VVKIKEQIVVPAKLHRTFGMKRGTQVFIYEKNGEIVIKPITDEYIESMAGMTGKKGELLKALREEKAKEHLL
jgi:AbrB family looped-hinge helix DNA binding protein